MQHLIPVGKTVAMKILSACRFLTKTIRIIVHVKVVILEKTVACMNVIVRRIAPVMLFVEPMLMK